MSQPTGRGIRNNVPRLLRYKPQYVVVIGDTHFGCLMAPCNPIGFLREGGARMPPSAFQHQLNERWAYFHDVWVPHKTKGRPYSLVHLGDTIDNYHHETQTLISISSDEQRTHAVEMLGPIVGRAREFYQIAGTEAHAGKNACHENYIAKELGARRDEYNRYARWQLQIKLSAGRTAGFTHHRKRADLSARITMADASKHEYKMDDFNVGGHIHELHKFSIPARSGEKWFVTVPPWQAKGPFGYKVKAETTPIIGGVILEVDEFGDTMVWYKAWDIAPPSSVPIVFDKHKELPHETKPRRNRHG